MKLVSAQVREYKSVWDSNKFEVGDVTCLVGKNEAGKTAILQALYRLNPLIEGDSEFDVVDDYPRSEVEEYQEAVEDGDRSPASVIEAYFELSDADFGVVAAKFGKKALKSKVLKLTRSYKKSEDDDSPSRVFELSVDDEQALKFLYGDSKLPEELKKSLQDTGVEFSAAQEALEEEETTEAITKLQGLLEYFEKNGVSHYIYNELLKQRVPKFLYFDEYYQMKGHLNIEALQKREQNETLEPSDYPMLGLIGLARIKMDELLSPERTQELKNKLEGAGNRLGKKVLKYWSQNKHIQMRFDVRPGNPGDPEGMKTGHNIWADVYDSRHMVTTNLGTRSKGFVWFFSFMAWYSQIEKENKGTSLVLLLDEPGLFLHGKAQGDLLRFIEEDLKDKHQVLYSTHSPFMVDSSKFDRIRVVQDRGIDSSEELSRDKDGTKILGEVFEANEDSLFPLQGALGYEIYQTLFVGPNSLIVEGVSDLLYLQTISSILERLGRVGLDHRWTITPVGGATKVPTFVSLLGSQKGLNIATLLDCDTETNQLLKNLVKERLMEKKKVLTYAKFTGSEHADIEDLFGVEFYLSLINSEFKGCSLSLSDLADENPRILRRLSPHVGKLGGKNGRFNHYRPARYLAENLTRLEKEMPSEALDRFETMFKTVNKLL